MSELWAQLTEEGIVSIFKKVQEEQLEERRFLAALQGVDVGGGKEEEGEGQAAVKARVHRKFTPPAGATVTYISGEAPVEELRARGIIGNINKNK